MQELTLMAGSLKLTALASGPPLGPPMLALHGWMDNAASFEPLANELPECRIVALELPGHGGSDSGGDYFSFLDNLTVIRQALGALGWSRIDLVGHSMGGGLAACYSALFPAAVRTLVSIDSYGPISMGKQEAGAVLRRAVHARGALPGKRYFADVDAAVAARTNADLPQAAARILARRGLEQSAEGWTWRGDRRLKWPSLMRLTEDQVLSLLAAIESPHLVLLAENPLAPHFKDLIAARLATTPASQEDVVPGGHHLHMEQPQRCATLIRNFLACHGK